MLYHTLHGSSTDVGTSDQEESNAAPSKLQTASSFWGQRSPDCHEKEGNKEQIITL